MEPKIPPSLLIRPGDERMEILRPIVRKFLTTVKTAPVTPPVTGDSSQPNSEQICVKLSLPSQH